MLTLFFTAFGLGLIFNAAPGAVFAETVRQGMQGGYRAAFAVQVGSLVGDASWAVLGLLAIGFALQLDGLRWPVGLAGVAYLIYLSWDSWQASKIVHEMDASTPPNTERAMRKGVALSLSNPQNVAYWAAMGSAMGAIGVTQPTMVDYGIFFLGFMVASVAWCFVCAALVDQLSRRTDQLWARFTYRLCAVALLLLALGNLRDLLENKTATGTAPPAFEVIASGFTSDTR
jgi:chemosensory pili system protein ChpE/L-lysine exporter family protein LysE/ArgO